VAKSVAHTALKTWISDCRIVDESGATARVSLHQFRHTLGTRLINNDVPQEVVRKILDHDSAEMTAHYARLHDDTVRRHWERARKVDINGNEVTIAPDSPLADAEWTKQHLSRATQACRTATAACRCSRVARTRTPVLPARFSSLRRSSYLSTASSSN
jgi:hypothetical protein